MVAESRLTFRGPSPEPRDVGSGWV
jgi:hypothetical protein